LKIDAGDIAPVEIVPPTNKPASITGLIIIYLFLVGLPLASLPFILKAGNSRLIAPLAVSGDWSFEFGGNAASIHCPWPGFKFESANIVQSGSGLTIFFSGPSRLTLLGTLHGSDVQGHERVSQREVFRRDGPELGFTATVRGQGKDRSMEGNLFFDSATGCGILPFLATRSGNSRRIVQ
jgi:hypothetical protein